MAPERRAALVAWARDTGGVIVEDDYDAEHRYDRSPVGAVQGLAPDHVVHVHSVSKTLAPGAAARLGGRARRHWPPSWPRPSGAATSAPRCSSSSRSRDLIERGELDRHLRRLRPRYRRRRDALVGALLAGRADLAVEGVAAGPARRGPPAASLRRLAVVAAAAARGVAVADDGRRTPSRRARPRSCSAMRGCPSPACAPPRPRCSPRWTLRSDVATIGTTSSDEGRSHGVLRGHAARVLVVANRTAATPALMEAVRERAARGPAIFTLLVPSSAHGLHQLVDPEDQGRSEAEDTIELALPLLEQAAGAPVEPMVGVARAARGDPGRDQPARLRRADHLHAADARVELAQARPAAQGGRARAPRHHRHRAGHRADRGARLGAYPGASVSPFWIWMQVVIVVCVLISAVIAIVKLV